MLNKHVLAFLVGAFSFLWVQFSYAASAIPADYMEPGFSNKRDYTGDQPNEYIDPFGGSLHLVYKDLVVRGNGGMDIVVNRVYHSLTETGGYLSNSITGGGRTTTGVGWDVHFGRVWPNGTGVNQNTNPAGCKRGSSNASSNPVLELADGTRKILVDADSTAYSYITKDRWIAKCITAAEDVTGYGGLKVISPEGTEYLFTHKNRTALTQAWSDAPYSITKITDVNGNWMQFSYLNPNYNYLTTFSGITTSDGRTVSFTYDYTNPNNSTSLVQQTGKAALRSITVGSQTVRYNYSAYIDGDNFQFLNEAVRPNNTSWDYTYYPSTDLNGLYSLWTSTSPADVKTTYTYTAVGFYTYLLGTPTNRVVSQKTVSGGGVVTGTWTYAYVPSTGGTVNDKTTVKSPLGCVVYQHFGLRQAASESIWKIGTLVSKKIYNDTNCTALLQQEDYTWDKLTVSQQNAIARYITGYDSNTYDPKQVKKVITRNSTTYTTTYPIANFDIYGNPQVATEAGQDTKTLNFTYYNDTAKWIIGKLDKETIVNASSNGNSIIDRTFDTLGRVTKQSHFSSSSTTDTADTSYSYYATGDVQRVTDALGNYVVYSNYEKGIPKNEARYDSNNILLKTLSRMVDTQGNVTAETNGRGKTTYYSYDELNRIEQVLKPLGSAINIAWTENTFGIQKVITRGAYSQTTQYDGLGRMLSQSDNSLSRTFTNDAEGRQISATNPTVSFTYDYLGRIKTQTHKNDAGNNVSVSYVYQTANKVQVTDELNKVTTYSYLSYGNPDDKKVISIAAPQSVTTTITRSGTTNKLGLITKVVQGGVTRSYTYDRHLFLTQEVHPETGTTIYGRDKLGRMTSKKVGASGVTNFGYDGLNRLTNTIYPAGTDNIVNTYDGNDNLETTTKGSTTWFYVFDDNDNLQSETLDITAPIAASYTLSYLYNANDALSQTTYPNGTTVAYSPDALGRPVQVGSFASGIDYFPNSQLKQLTLGNTHLVTYTQNTTRLLPKGMQVSGITDLSYSYDNVGNVASISDAVNSAYNRTFGYDGLNRLTSANGVWGAGTIAYDTANNITAKTLGANSLTYTYDTQKRLSSVTGATPYTFTYDVYGNVSNNSRNTFVYDDALNLKTLNQTTPINFTYDGNNYRVSSVKSTDTRYFVYSKSGSLMYEQNITTGDDVAYFYLQGSLLAQSAVTNGVGQVSYYHNDLLGSPIAATDQTGALLWREEYDPYGNKLLKQNTTNRLWYTGHVHDEDSGLTYMGARYYDPVVGRFMGFDPVGFKETNPISFNRYAYANNNPYKFVDPDGRDAAIIFSTEPDWKKGNKPDAWNKAVNYAKTQSSAAGYQDKDIHVFPVNTVSQVNAALKSYKDISQIYFIGHASDTGLYIGSQSGPDTNLSISSGNNNVLPSALDWSNLTKKAKIDIWGCHAGEGNNSIAQAIANTSGAKTTAPDSYLNFDDKTGAPFMRTVRFGEWKTFDGDKK